MDPKNFSPATVTEGQKRRTLRGMDGRIRHIETLASRWETRKIDETVAAAVAKATSDLQAAFSALTARVAALEPKAETAAA